MSISTGKRAVIYTRVSRDDSGEGKSNDRQEAEARRLTDYKRWEVVDVIRDVSLSAFGKKDRPGWNRVLDMIRNREVDYIVAYAMDRMTRNMLDLEKLIILADEHGVGIATVDGDIDLTSENGRMIARILAAVARAEVEIKARRQRLANDQRAAEGKPWKAGARPFGYADDHITIIPEEAEAIREGARRALEGESSASIAKYWNELGLLPARGDSKGWSTGGVRQLLVNPRYAGMRVHRGKNVGPAIWDPILDPDTHYRLVEQRLGNRSKLSANSGRTGAKPQTLLTGIMRCSKCKEPVYGSRKRDVLTYTCQATHQYIERDSADLHVEALSTLRLMEPDIVDVFRREGPEVSGPNVQELDDRLKMLARLLGSGAMSEEEYIEAAAVVREEMAEVKAAGTTVSLPREFRDLKLGTEAVRAQWLDMALSRKRAVVAALWELELLPKGRGRRRPMPADEQIKVTPRLGTTKPPAPEGAEAVSAVSGEPVG